MGSFTEDPSRLHLGLFGGVWFLQGINMLPGSFMTGQIRWAVYGDIAVIVGVILLSFKDARPTRPTEALRAEEASAAPSTVKPSGIIPCTRECLNIGGIDENPNPMIDIQQFENIKQKHGSYASWAVWADASEKPKSNMGDVSYFKNESVLSLLKNNVVMVGLNLSGSGF